MSQHDYVIANQTFPNFRTDLNSAFAASVSQNSGASAPSTTYAYQLWYDTGNDILKMRNADNDAWIDLFTVDQTADTASAPSVAAGSNLIINGNMAVSQRGTSHSYAHDGTRNAYNLDRFKFQFRNTSDEYDCTVAQVSDSPDGFSNSLKITTGTAESAIGADEYYQLYQPIEAQNLQLLGYGTSSAKAMTLSFYVKSSLTGTFASSFYQEDDNRILNKTYTINTANTWERKTISIPADTTGVIDNNNGGGMWVYWGFGTGSDFDGGTTATNWAAYTTTNFFDSSGSDALITTAGATWQITGVQLEVGSVANPVFQHENYAETLRKCQRYFYRIGGNETDALGLNVGRIASGVMTGISASNLMRPNPVTMRDAPNVTFDDALANYTVMTSRTTNAVTAVGDNISTASTTAFGLTCGASSNDGDGAVLRSTRAQSTVSVDAEL